MLKYMWAHTKVFIRNQNVPVYKTCMYFEEDATKYFYDAMPKSKLYGTCTRFGQINYVTGVTEYDYAVACRNDIRKCGVLGSEHRVTTLAPGGTSRAQKTPIPRDVRAID